MTTKGLIAIIHNMTLEEQIDLLEFLTSQQIKNQKETAKTQLDRIEAKLDKLLSAM